MLSCQRISIVGFMVLFFCTAHAWAETRYIADQLVVSLRAQPQSNAETIVYLRTDTPVEVIDVGEEYVQVKTENGEEIWRQDLKKTLGARPPTWGISTSPLIDGDRLILGNVALVLQDAELAGEADPGRTQMRVAYVEPPERMALVPRLLAELFTQYEQARAGREAAGAARG